MFAALHVAFFVMNCYTLLAPNLDEIIGKGWTEDKGADDSSPLLMNRIIDKRAFASEWERGNVESA